MDASAIEWIIFGPLIAGLLLFSWWAAQESHARLDDPNDDRTLYLEQLPGKVALFPFGTYRVTILRQSGNVHAEHIVTGSAQDALAAAMSTFRRAKIGAVHVPANSETELLIGRLYHDHRGTKEGKKVGQAHITLLERGDAPEPAVPPEPSFSFQPLPITCDCGERAEVPFADIAQPRACAACGKDMTLPPSDIAQIEAAAEELRAEALARYHAGDTEVRIERKITTTDPVPPDELDPSSGAAGPVP